MNQLSMPFNEFFGMKKMMQEQREKIDSLSTKLALCDVPAKLQSKTVEGTKQAAMFGPKQQFPEKLYKLLEMADHQKFGCSSNAVSWMPHGKAFKIHDEEVFMKEIVPMFFKQSKLRSFNRQCALWGFKRFTAGPDLGAWYHESFIRGSPSQMQGMVRIKIKGGTACSDQNEPNFYLPTYTLQRNTSYAEISLSSNEASVDQVISQHRTFLEQIDVTSCRRVSLDFDAPLDVSSAYSHSFGTSPEPQRVLSESLNPSKTCTDQPVDEFAQFIDAAIHVL